MPRYDNTAEKPERYREFWQGLIGTLVERGFTGPRKAHTENEFCFASGYGDHVRYGAKFPRGRMAQVEVYIDSKDKGGNKALFDLLKEDRDAIESEIGKSLEWDEKAGRKAFRIVIARYGSIDDDQETLEGIQGWMVEKLLEPSRSSSSDRPN